MNEVPREINEVKASFTLNTFVKISEKKEELF